MNAPDHSTESPSTVNKCPSGNTPQNAAGRFGAGSEREPKRKSYMKIRCPSEICQHEMVLACPYCHKGALRCSGSNYTLTCDCCRSSLRAIACDCGFTIKGSYVFNKQKRLDELLQAADVDAYKAIGTLFVCFGVFAAILSLLGG